ncbi:hypothetical protein IC229_23175 [Spirosoma sp. BT702]|uniref:Uncharacterized protein n=1 Tax=Spirosoma profusum TaxID=2771354 RepID=A0A926Y4Q7_9BACT|nr:hypothetical protein [Spirosoma profusum]MBD2703565.1 hypothetical protein [Spirosoma profusum]
MDKLNHWVNELMNLIVGNSRYVSYTLGKQLVFLVSILLFLVLTYFFVDSYFNQ